MLTQHYLKAFSRACDEKNTATMNDLVANVDTQSLTLNDLLALISLCINGSCTQYIHTFFKKALLIKHTLTDELKAILNRLPLTAQSNIKQLLIAEAVKVQTSFSELLALGLLYRDNEQFAEAERLFLQLIEKNPGDCRGYHRLISVYIRMQRYHDAIACCLLALEIDADSITAHYNLGVAQMALNRDSEAFNAFMKTVELDSQNRWAHINLAQIILKQGYFDKGWQQYEWRKRFYEKPKNDISTAYPEWNGQDLTEKTLLLCADQGLGDIIMYAGLINRLPALGAKLLMVAEPRLKCLFERSFPLSAFFSSEITSKDQAKYRIDYQIPLSGLGARFIHSFTDFHQGSAYLMADPHRSQSSRETLKQRYNHKRLIGFSWRGGTVDTRKFARNIPLPQWQQLLQCKGCTFINLQYDSSAAENATVEALGAVNLDLDHRHDIDGIASVLQAIDLLVSMDNSTAHIAAALGKPVWNLLPYSGEWRWFLEPHKSYWYSSMRLFRQQTPDNWSHCLLGVEQALAEINNG